MQTYVELDGGLVIKTDEPSLWKDGKRLSRKEGEAKRKAYCRERLLEILKPGATVYTVLRHVSRSGMRRRIDLYTVIDGENRYLSAYAADLVGETLHKDGGISIDGGGMDMGFELVYRLGHALWPNGTPSPHSTRNGEPDCDGGYALKHEWL